MEILPGQFVLVYWSRNIESFSIWAAWTCLWRPTSKWCAFWNRWRERWTPKWPITILVDFIEQRHYFLSISWVRTNLNGKWKQPLHVNYKRDFYGWHDTCAPKKLLFGEYTEWTLKNNTFNISPIYFLFSPNLGNGASVADMEVQPVVNVQPWNRRWNDRQWSGPPIFDIFAANLLSGRIYLGHNWRQSSTYY